MTYYRPTDLSEAFDILAQSGARILAGGTDIFPAETGRELRGEVLDITAIAALSGISQTKDGWRIGGAATWTDVINAPLPAAFNALQQAAHEVGSLQIQNSATVAGNLCNASPAADGVPPLLVLDVMVEIGSQRGVRHLPLSEFIKGVRNTALLADEIVTAIHVPQAATGGASAFQKLGARKYLVISICMVAARIKVVDGVISNAAISVGACGPVASRLTTLEATLIGANITDPSAWRDAIERQITTVLAPIDDIRADASYRITAAAELVSSTITDAIQAGTA